MTACRASAARGFTLLETLLALMVAAVAATVIIAMLRGLMDRANREQRHLHAAMQLVNEAARARSLPLNEATPKFENKRLHLIFRDPNLPAVEVRNINVLGGKSQLPPIEAAYTPFQSFHLSKDKYSIAFLAPALDSPEPAKAKPDSSAGRTP